MRFTDSPVIELTVKNSKLAFHQDNGSMHVGTTVWPASLVLVKFAERWHPPTTAATTTTPNPYAALLDFTNKRAVELGTGCGVAAMGLYLLGLTDVVLTDIAPVMPALKHNLKRNKPVLGRMLKSAQLHWTNSNQINSLGPPFDIVIAADVVYIEESVGPLVSAMESLVSDKGVVLLGYQIRSPEAHLLFWEVCGRVFDIEKVPHEHLHPDYAYEESDVFVLRKKKKEIENLDRNPQVPGGREYRFNSIKSNKIPAPSRPKSNPPKLTHFSSSSLQSCNTFPNSFFPSLKSPHTHTHSSFPAFLSSRLSNGHHAANSTSPLPLSIPTKTHPHTLSKPRWPLSPCRETHPLRPNQLPLQLEPTRRHAVQLDRHRVPPTNPLRNLPLPPFLLPLRPSPTHLPLPPPFPPHPLPPEQLPHLLPPSLPPSVVATCHGLTHLDLSQNYLVGPLPSTLPNLPGLTYLNLDGNSLTGPIPNSFGTFPNLEVLILTNNLLNGTIPISLSNVTTLKELDLAYNPFFPARISPEFGNLTNLEQFWLSGCNLFGQIPDSFDQLSLLSNLDVSYNHFSGGIPNVIFRLPSIVQIELFSNSFTGSLPSHWSNLTNLRRFDASLNELNGTIPDELCQLPLGSLGLYQNNLVGTLPEAIAQSPNLYEIRLFNNQLTGSLPSQLGLNSPLETIDVSYNNLSGEIPANLFEKGVLSELVLISNLFTGVIPEGLGKCTSLGRVRLTGNRLYGEVPAGFWGLPHVYLLDIAGNSFSGNISSRISGAFNLSTLDISNNGFSGRIPDEVGSVWKLQKLLASGNSFSGEIPESLTKLNQLENLDLSGNNLVGGIPTGIGLLKQLNELNLGSNGLTGEITDEVGSLPVLNYLDLSNNSFLGRIPIGLQNLRLNKLNLSNNRLTGEIPAVFDNEVYSDSFSGNPGLCGDLVDVCGKESGRRWQSNLWLFRAVFVAAAVVFVVGIGRFVFRFRKLQESNKGGEATITKWRSFHKLGFSENEIVDCLNEDNVIGSGSSGKVYKASLSNGEVVAVKKLWERSGKDDDDTCFSFEKDGFESEVQTLGKIRHKNIVRLWCCCHTGNVKLLVYEYMPNGSLGELLHGSKGRMLDWPTRIRIALDAAEGLSYLHHDCAPPIVHRDVKSNNILLDEEFGARIADFGVAKIFKAVNEGPESMSAIAGSCGYIAPEYAYTLGVNEKSDVYSFGVVILELITGRRPIDPEFGEKDLASWVRSNTEQKGRDHVLDPNLESCFKEQIRMVLDIGLLCTSPLPISRPSMRRVVKLLQEVRAVNKPRTATMDGTLSPYYFEDFSSNGTLV